jgi:hypothetical protein
MLENEVAADNQRRMYDKLSRTPIDHVIAVTGDAVSAVVPFLGSGLRIADLIRNLGVPTVEENLDYLSAATEDAISRLERRAVALGESISSIQCRFESREFQDCIAAAVLQTQRTKQKARLRRMALILANGLAVNDINPEELDDLLRAAAELKEADVALLGKLYESQVNLVNQALSIRGEAPHNWHQHVQIAWRQFIDSGGLNPQNHLNYRSSFSRLESFGLIQHVDSAGSYGVGCDIYALLAEGKKFCERVKETESD